MKETLVALSREEYIKRDTYLTLHFTYISYCWTIIFQAASVSAGSIETASCRLRQESSAKRTDSASTQLSFWTVGWDLYLDSGAATSSPYRIPTTRPSSTRTWASAAEEASKFPATPQLLQAKAPPGRIQLWSPHPVRTPPRVREATARTL
eukprot:5781051-Pyramimonas_sp.AAC.2